jgi:hypothetical protein
MQGTETQRRTKTKDELIEDILTLQQEIEAYEERSQ